MRIACDWCLKNTTREPRHGRRTRKHKCPHGTWCPRAQPRLLHNNHYPRGGPDYCEHCERSYWKREHERIENKFIQPEAGTVIVSRVVRIGARKGKKA
jgi:hypothetical protein